MQECKKLVHYGTNLKKSQINSANCQMLAECNMILKLSGVERQDYFCYTT